MLRIVSFMLTFGLFASVHAEETKIGLATYYTTKSCQREGTSGVRTANNERFDAIVREFQKESQFIIITHSKRTMSVTDMLYGVTMQTQGISKKISVNFDHYSSEPAAA